MEAKGIAVWQLGIGDDAWGGSRPAEAGGTANARGDEQEPSQAGLVGRVRNTG